MKIAAIFTSPVFTVSSITINQELTYDKKICSSKDKGIIY